jgi:lysophospholipase L1-like esterase
MPDGHPLREGALRKLFVLGDSISIQYGPYLAQMLRGAFAYSRKEPMVRPSPDLPYSADANGGDSSMVLAYLRQWLAVISPDVLLLNCGLHDLRTDPQIGTKQVPPDRYRANLRGIAQLVGCHGARTVWVRTTPVDDETHNSQSVGFHRFGRDVLRYNEIADGVFNEAGIPTIDLYTFTLNLGDGPYCDHVHFTARVRELQAAYIAGSLLAFV